MTWVRQGRIFIANQQFPWMVSHAANPYPYVADENRLGVLFNVRDAENRAHIAALFLDPQQPKEIIELLDRPLLLPGADGTFDESGCSIGNCVIDAAGRLCLYYIGWTLGSRTAFYNSIGLAFGNNPTSEFQRFSLAPVLGRSAREPYSLSYPWVMRVEDGSWRMLYGATTRWLSRTSMTHELHEARSRDGISWEPIGRPILPLLEEETAHSRPCLILSKNIYELWFSVKTPLGYHIGYAISQDGENWERQDEVRGLFPGEAEWENAEVCYPSVINFGGKTYLFYCGNGYGATGFGLAVWESD